MPCRIKTEIAKYGDDIIELYEFPGRMGGNHKECGYTLTIKSVGTYNVIHCGACGLRIKFPSHIKDIKSLKRFLVDGDDTKEKTPTRFELMDVEDENT